MLLNFLVVGKTQIFFGRCSSETSVVIDYREETEVATNHMVGQVLKRSSNDERKPFSSGLLENHMCLCCKGNGRIQFHDQNAFLVGEVLCRSTRDIHLSLVFKIEFIMLEIVWNISDVSHPDMKQFVRTTVDGRNPKQTPGMCKTM